jgi:CDP-diacylglycerol---serine O-phosphatidyltransferase
MDTQNPPRRPRRGAYLLPNLFTTGGMMAGFYAIVAAIGGRYEEAAIAVFVAGVLDGIDGRVARLTNTQSAFGVQYDSLADLVSFGLAPALVMYMWSLAALKGYSPLLGKVGWAAAFLYAACAALRLARFNTQVGSVDKRWFIGLSSPAAAGLMMSYVWALADLGADGYRWAPLSLAVTVVAALLMVSRIRYWSFKGGGNDDAHPDRVPFLTLVMMVGVFVLVAIEPPRVLLAIGVTYMVSGPLMALWRRRPQSPTPAA